MGPKVPMMRFYPTVVHVVLALTSPVLIVHLSTSHRIWMIPKDAGTNFLPVRFAIGFWLYIDFSIPVVALGLLGPPDALRPSAALACCNTSCAEHIKVIARLHVHGYHKIDDNFSRTRCLPKQGFVQIRSEESTLLRAVL